MFLWNELSTFWTAPWMLSTFISPSFLLFPKEESVGDQQGENKSVWTIYFCIPVTFLRPLTFLRPRHGKYYVDVGIHAQCSWMRLLSGLRKANWILMVEGGRKIRTKGWRERQKRIWIKERKNNLKSLSSFSLYKLSITIIACIGIIQDSNIT